MPNDKLITCHVRGKSTWKKYVQHHSGDFCHETPADHAFGRPSLLRFDNLHLAKWPTKRLGLPSADLSNLSTLSGLRRAVGQGGSIDKLEVACADGIMDFFCERGTSSSASSDSSIRSIWTVLRALFFCSSFAACRSKPSFLGPSALGTRWPLFHTPFPVGVFRIF